MNNQLIKPDFIIAGAPKSGTSSLIRYLNLSSKVSCITALESGSEPHFFSKEYKKGSDWYSNLFIKFPKKNIIGEKSVSYMVNPSSAKRINSYCPNVKLIFLLRNPIDRAYSQYKANIQRGTEFVSFKTAIELEKYRLLFFKNNYSYVRRGCYSIYLEPFLDIFPRNNLLFLLTEDLLKKPETTIEKINSFLNLDINKIDVNKYNKRYNVSKTSKHVSLSLLITFYRRYFRKLIKLNKLDRIVINIEKRNSSDEKFPAILPDIRKKLVDYYKPFNEELSSMTGLDLSIWNH